MSMINALKELYQLEAGRQTQAVAVSKKIAVRFISVTKYPGIDYLASYHGKALAAWAERVHHWSSVLRQLNPVLATKFEEELRMYRALKDAVHAYESLPFLTSTAFDEYLLRNVKFLEDHNPNRGGRAPLLRDVKIFKWGVGLNGTMDLDVMSDIVNAVRRTSKRRNQMANLEHVGGPLKKCCRFVCSPLALTDGTQ